MVRADNIKPRPILLQNQVWTGSRGQRTPNKKPRLHRHFKDFSECTRCDFDRDARPAQKHKILSEGPPPTLCISGRGLPVSITPHLILTVVMASWDVRVANSRRPAGLPT